MALLVAVTLRLIADLCWHLQQGSHVMQSDGQSDLELVSEPLELAAGGTAFPLRLLLALLARTAAEFEHYVPCAKAML